jgi:hypothetical protein
MQHRVNKGLYAPPSQARLVGLVPAPRRGMNGHPLTGIHRSVGVYRPLIGVSRPRRFNFNPPAGAGGLLLLLTEAHHGEDQGVNTRGGEGDNAMATLSPVYIGPSVHIGHYRDLSGIIGPVHGPSWASRLLSEAHHGEDQGVNVRGGEGDNGMATLSPVYIGPSVHIGHYRDLSGIIGPVHGPSWASRLLSEAHHGEDQGVNVRGGEGDERTRHSPDSAIRG